MIYKRLKNWHRHFFIQRFSCCSRHFLWKMQTMPNLNHGIGYFFNRFQHNKVNLCDKICWTINQWNQCENENYDKVMWWKYYIYIDRSRCKSQYTFLCWQYFEIINRQCICFFIWNEILSKYCEIDRDKK